MATARSRLPPLGPNLMRHVEQSLACLAGLGIAPERRLLILRAVDTYAMGNAEAGFSRGPAGTGSAEEHGWQAAAEAYLHGLTSSGAYPGIAELGAGALLRAG